MNKELKEVLQGYCKLKKFTLKESKGAYTIHKKDLTLMTLLIQGTFVELSFNGIKEVKSMDIFIEDLTKEVWMGKELRRTNNAYSAYKRRGTFPMKYKRRKINTFEKAYIINKQQYKDRCFIS